MKTLYSLWLIIVIAKIGTGQCVSTKMDFGNDDVTLVTTNSTNIEGEDVEVKHTIVLSTKVKNNNRKGIHGRFDGDSIQSFNIGHSKSHNEEDSAEVPVVKGYNAVETTQIKTPDTRHRDAVHTQTKIFDASRRSQMYPESVFVSRNIRDDLDIYPNVANNPLQWKPSGFYNNINWWQQNGRDFERRNYRPVQDAGTFNRKISDDAMKEFYCGKCRELMGSSGRGCIKERSHSWIYETTTPKLKLDGKLAKLN